MSEIDPASRSVAAADRVERADPRERRWLSVELAAAYASVSEQTIRRLIGAGKLTPYRPVSGRVVVDRRQLDALVLSSTGPARSGRGRYPRGRAAS